MLCNAQNEWHDVFTLCYKLLFWLFDRFVMGVFIGGKQIAEVTCSNKKDGRKEAADKALRALIASGDYKGSNSATVSNSHQLKVSIQLLN